MGQGDELLLEVEGVSKAFPGVLANDAIAFDLKAGEIHALLGENGAGKTTLMGILFGLHVPDEGRILLRGEEFAPSSPHEAIVRGIGFVQQHYSLIPMLTVIENLVLSSHYGGALPLPRAEIEKRVTDIARRHGLSLDLDAEVQRLSVGEQQHVELIKALIAEPRVLILDEPAALLSAPEVEQLWQILSDLAKAGVGIILIGHKLEEVLTAADRITVLRRGKVIATVAAADVDAAALGAMMVGDLKERGGERICSAGGEMPTVLEVRALRVAGDRGQNLVKDLSFSVRRGEVLGIAGVAGGGQIELMEVIAGIRRAQEGAVGVDGVDVSALSVRERKALGIAFIPPDRQRDGLVGPLSLADNFALSAVGDPPVARSGILDAKAIDERAQALIRRFDIRAPAPSVHANTLSGGNQQKLILARELARDPEIILACYPTRGLDFAATAAVHDELLRAADRGAAVVVVSIDLGELFALADRLIVIQGGRIVGETPTHRASAAEIGVMLGGGVPA